MKIDQDFLKFPKFLPNDFEAFMLFYPAKFPGIVPYYEEVAKKIATDPDAYKKYGYQMRKELFEGFKKIKDDYDKGDKGDLSFLVDIDQRFHKLICYRFWIVNYLFPDGPLHDYFVSNIKSLTRKFVPIGEDLEDYESRVLQTERDLLQGDYADLYLQQAISGVKIVNILATSSFFRELYTEAIKIIDGDSIEKNLMINSVWDKVIKDLDYSTEPEVRELKKELEVPLIQSKFRNSFVPVYNMLTHALEFRKENKDLQDRYSGMRQKVNEYFSEAGKVLSNEEQEVLRVSYEQVRNFAMFKDVMGEIDPELLPVWFGLLFDAQSIIGKTTLVPDRSMGQSGIFYHLVWYLPPNLKAKVMTPDLSPFDTSTI